MTSKSGMQLSKDQERFYSDTRRISYISMG